MYTVKVVLILRPKKNVCVFHVSRHYLGFSPDLNLFIVNFEEYMVKYTEKSGGGGSI